jgi:hypothetical protein
MIAFATHSRMAQMTFIYCHDWCLFGSVSFVEDNKGGWWVFGSDCRVLLKKKLANRDGKGWSDDKRGLQM